MWATISYPAATTMLAQPLPTLASGDPSAWDQALYAFLIEKGNRSDRTPSSTTVGARIACLSSFYRFGSWLCLQQSSRPTTASGRAVPDLGRTGRRERPECRGHRVDATGSAVLRKTAGVPPSGFEPLISTLKGSCPRPLDDGGAARTAV